MRQGLIPTLESPHSLGPNLKQQPSTAYIHKKIASRHGFDRPFSPRSRQRQGPERPYLIHITVVPLRSRTVGLTYGKGVAVKPSTDFGANSGPFQNM